jgi:hypothetical protein
MSLQDNSATLARIRENQRRSRARRKDYILDLETRLRQCEARGVTATAEIQEAARRVLVENRLLRKLLDTCGFGGNEIQLWLASNETIPTAEELGETSDASTRLGSLMDGQKRCPAEEKQNNDTLRANPFYKSAGTSPAHTYRPASPAVISTVARQQLSCTPSPTIESSGGSNTGSNTSRIDTTSPNGWGEQLPASWLPPQLPLTPMGDYYQLQSEPTIHNAMNPPAEHYTIPHQHQYPSLNTAIAIHEDQYSQLATIEPGGQSAGFLENTTQNLPNQNSTPGKSCCIVASEIITAMAGGEADPLDVRNDLGCPPAGDTQCEVDNQLVFEVMDRYTRNDIST